MCNWVRGNALLFYFIQIEYFYICLCLCIVYVYVCRIEEKNENVGPTTNSAESRNNIGTISSEHIIDENHGDTQKAKKYKQFEYETENRFVSLKSSEFQ